MGNEDTTTPSDDKVRSFHVASKEHSFHLEGGDEDKEKDEGGEEGHHSFHLVEKDKSFRKID